MCIFSFFKSVPVQHWFIVALNVLSFVVLKLGAYYEIHGPTARELLAVRRLSGGAVRLRTCYAGKQYFFDRNWQCDRAIYASKLKKNPDIQPKLNQLSWHTLHRGGEAHSTTMLPNP